ncbi:MAG: hypothetical protein R3F62_14340 [Planctomycetota bacterium]
MPRSTSQVALCALLIGCSAPTAPPAAPPRALAAALGAPSPAPGPVGDDPREVARLDVAPFVEAGHPDAASRLHDLLDGLLRARAAGRGARAPELALEPSGHVLRVRAEDPELALAHSVFLGLRAEVTTPIALDVHLLEVPSARVGALPGPAAGVQELLVALRQDLEQGAAQTLVRRRLRLTPGLRASARETYARRPAVRVTLEDGLPVVHQETVEDGLALHATAWLGARGDALAHLELALQREAAEEPRTLAVGYRREGAATEAGIDLPQVVLAGLRAQLRLEQGAWQVAAAGPAERPGRALLALVRASWTAAPTPDGEYRSLRVALPHRVRELAEEAEAKKSAFFGSSMFGGRTEHVLDGLEQEFFRQQAVTVHNDLGFGLGVRLAPPNPVDDAGWTPLFPEELAAQRARVEALSWGPGTELVYLWDQLHVLHDASVADRLQSLLEAVEAWRNRPLRVQAEWIEAEPQALEGLDTVAALRAALPDLRAGRVLDAYTLSARSGAWTELSASHNAAVLWGSFGPDRASPETRVVTRGSRLGVRPRRYGDGRLELALRFGHQQVNGASLTPVAQGAGWIHKPRFHESTLEHTLTVTPGEPQLLLGESTPDGRRLRALVVTCWE